MEQKNPKKQQQKTQRIASLQVRVNLNHPATPILRVSILKLIFLCSYNRFIFGQIQIASLSALQIKHSQQLISSTI